MELKYVLLYTYIKLCIFFNHFCPIFSLGFMFLCSCSTCEDRTVDLRKQINCVASIWDVGMRVALSLMATLGMNEYSGVNSPLICHFVKPTLIS